MSTTIYQDLIRDHRDYIILLIDFQSRRGWLSKYLQSWSDQHLSKRVLNMLVLVLISLATLKKTHKRLLFGDKIRKTLHEWKNNSVLAKPLAASTHLCSTVSQLFKPQVQKKTPFSRTAAHIFVSLGDAPAIVTQYVAWMERQFNACQTPRSMRATSSIVSELYDA